MAEAGGDWVVDEEEGEAAVPCEGIGKEVTIIGEKVRPKFEEVSDHGRTAGAALEPKEDGGGGRRGEWPLGFIEGEEEGRGGAVGVDREVAGFGGESWFGVEIFRWLRRR